MESVMSPVVERVVEATPLDGLKVSWGGIWSGVLVVLGMLLLLTTFGLAVGISAADPGETEPGTLGTAAAIWSGLSLLIALFVGGMAATRLGMVFDKATGYVEGALVWVLSFLVILWLAGSGVSLVASGMSGLFGGVTKTVGAAVGSGIEDIASGNPEQVLNRLRDPETARTVAAATGMPEHQVRAEFSQLEQRVNQAQNDPARVAQEVRQTTNRMIDRARARAPEAIERMQPGASKTAWATLVAMLLSLIAAVGGAALGRRRAIDRMDTAVAP
jgi:hypothetical protein